MSEDIGTNKPLAFISHLHEDADIANAVGVFIHNRSLGAVEVFSSSSSWASAPDAGRPLRAELVKKLRWASVVVLIYTDPQQDWSYPMWECGVATDAEAGDARPIVFQTTRGSPPMFEDKVRIDVRNEDEIYSRFVKPFMTKTNFFPERSAAITQFTQDDPAVREAAAGLHSELQRLLLPDEFGQYEPWVAYPFLRLSIRLGSEKALVKQVETDNCYRAVLEQCRIDSETDDAVGALFGWGRIPRDAVLDDFVQAWRQKYSDASDSWADSLCEQVVRGAEFKFHNVPLQLMRSVDTSNTNWYAPILNVVRPVPRMRRLEFDIFFNKFVVDGQNRVVAGLQSNDLRGARTHERPTPFAAGGAGPP